MLIRSATPEDYAAIVEVHNTCWPEHFRSPQDFARFDTQTPTQRFLAEENGQTVGHAHLRKYTSYLEVEVAVLPDWRSRGLGRRLYGQLQPLFPKPLAHPLLGFVKEVHPYALEFAQHRGFRESRRTYHQYLKLPDFDSALFEGLWSKLQTQGYQLIAYQDLTQADKEQRYYQLFIQTESDVPMTAAYQPPSLETFQTQILRQDFLPEASFVALRQGQLVGLSSTRGRTASTWHTRITGVLPQHRGHGLAVALKAKVAQAAKMRGILELHTNNAAGNVGMLAVNQKLGFVREPAQIEVSLYPKLGFVKWQEGVR